MKKLLMGNEAIALGALRAGVRVITGYPGTPSTEILETAAREAPPPVRVEWSVNEKAALELAAGAAMCGARALVTMKQVGLNVASDPLMSLNYLGVSGGLVVAVADDPGPLSSQTEQDTRRFGLCAKVAVFDPSSPEEAYVMAARAFEYSEKYGRPVILRPTTRVCHSYAAVDLDALLLPSSLPVAGRPQEPGGFPKADGFDKADGRWVIFPGLAYQSHRQIEADLLKMEGDFASFPGNALIVTPGASGETGPLGIAAGGVSYAYAREVLDPLPPGLKILKAGTFPFPPELSLPFLEGLEEVLVLEELDPVIEDELTRLCGRRHLRVDIRGKRSGDMPLAGEYSPALAAEKIDAFLRRRVWVTISELAKLPAGASGDFTALTPVPPAVLAEAVAAEAAAAKAAVAVAADAQGAPPPLPPPLPVRPPVLCAGCPHRGSFYAVKEAVRKYGGGRKAVFSGDIGCYTLGNAQPLNMVDTCLCMGAGITMAQGIHLVEQGTLNFAFIGDSTFFHTGIPGLVNAVYTRSDIIVVVLDNCTTAMTGNQPHPGTGVNARGAPAGRIDIPTLAAALGIRDLVRASPFDFAAAAAAVRGMLDKTGVRLIVFEGPCIAVETGTPRGLCVIDTARCTGCGLCVTRLGCPAISLISPVQPKAAAAGVRACIDAALCTGCGLCKNLCSAGAIGDGVPGSVSPGGKLP